MSTSLKTDPRFDQEYTAIKNILNELPIHDNGEFVYDVAKRLANEYSLGLSFIFNLYNFGFIQGKRAEKKAATSKKPKYMLLECESRRKDAQRIHAGSKTGMISKLVRILKEYTDEAEADRDMARLKADEITESDLINRKAHRTAKLI